jgi:hypothetical protein
MTEDLKSMAPSLSIDTRLTINSSAQVRQVSKRFNLDVSRVLPGLSKWLTENTWLSWLKVWGAGGACCGGSGVRGEVFCSLLGLMK